MQELRTDPIAAPVPQTRPSGIERRADGLTDRGTGTETGGGTGDGGDGDHGRRKVSPGWWAAIAAIVVGLGAGGYAVSEAVRSPSPSMTVTVISDSDAMMKAINGMDFKNEFDRKILLAAAKDHRIQLLEFEVLKTSTRDGAQSYRVVTDIRGQDYSLRPEPQRFVVPISPGQASFQFVALASVADRGMTGLWHTGAGDTRYDLRPGQTIPIRLR